MSRPPANQYALEKVQWVKILITFMVVLGFSGTGDYIGTDRLGKRVCVQVETSHADHRATFMGIVRHKNLYHISGLTKETLPYQGGQALPSPVRLPFQNQTLCFQTKQFRLIHIHGVLIKNHHVC